MKACFDPRFTPTVAWWRCFVVKEKAVLFKRDPAKKLRKSYKAKMEAAMHAMRQGDVRSNAMLVAEAEKIKEELDRLEGATQ